MGKRIPWVAVIVFAVISFMTVEERADAQPSYPTKPTQLVAAGSVSGATDILTRAIDQALTAEKMLDKPFSIVNKPAGGGNQATAFMVEQRGNGDILAVNNIRVVLNQLLGTIDYGLKDVTPIVRLTTEYGVWAVRADSKYKSALDVLAELNKDPNSVPFGVTSMQSNNYFHILMAAKHYGIDYTKLRVVALPAGGEMISQLLGGHVPIISTALSEIVAHVSAGKMRVLTISSPSRSNRLPGVPTWRDMGLDLVVLQWVGTLGVPDMPKIAYDYWVKKLSAMVTTKTWKDLLYKYELDDAFLAGEDFKKAFEREEAIYTELLGTLGLLKSQKK